MYKFFRFVLVNNFLQQKSFKMWTSKETKEIKGVKLFRQTTTVHNNKAYMLGGCDENLDFCPNFQVLDLETKLWKTLPGPKFFTSRSGQACFIDKGYFYCLGGLQMGFQQTTILLRFHISSETFENLKYSGELIDVQFGHTAVVYQSKVYIFGGAIDNNFREQQSNETYLYDIEANEMKKLKTNNENILPREAHSAILYKNQMIVFGGRSKDNRFNDLLSMSLDGENKNEWKFLEKRGSVPSKRATVSMGNYKDSLFIFGGFDGKTELCDLYMYDLKSQYWKNICLLGSVHPKVSLHSDAFFIKNGKISWLIFGGMVGDHVYEEVYEMSSDLAIYNCYKNTFVDILFKIFDQQ